MRTARAAVFVAIAAIAALAALAPAARGEDPKEPAAPADDPEARGYVGFGASPIGMLDESDRKDIAAKEGVVVTSVTPGMPGAIAGLRRGDVLVSIDGTPVPDGKGLTRQSEEGEFTKWQDAWKALFSKVKPGSKVAFVVRRGAETVSLEATATDFETRQRLEEAATEADEAKAPDPAGAGAPKATTFDFEAVESGVPEGFLVYRGLWEVRGEEGKANQVLLQDSSVEPWTSCLATGAGLALSDGKASVRWKPVSGAGDQTGGIVFRATDRRTYYLARANALENNLRIYVMQKDERRQIATLEVKPPATGAWHTLEVTFVGPKLTATLDGKETVSVTDETFTTGWTGLWTKGDSVTQFDDFKVEPAAAPGK
jgi:hypothetical protein